MQVNLEKKIKMKSKGLGDTVEKITKATGVKSLVEYVTADILKSDDCGCEKRKTKLNKMFPYKNK